MEKKKIVAYLRVSTEGQTEKYGLDLQRNKINEYCEKNGIVIDEWYVDGGFTGANTDRPALVKLLIDARSGAVGKVLVYKLDRISRDTVDTLNIVCKELKACNVEVISMLETIKTDNPMDKMALSINAAMNQYEREIIYLRTRSGMIERIKKGLWKGGGVPPYGYWYDRNDGILHIIEEEAEKVRQTYDLYMQGYSCERISLILGLKNENMARNILTKVTYAGYIDYKGARYKQLHEPIITLDKYNQVQAYMAKRSTHHYSGIPKLLSGLCYCGKCGTKMRYMYWKNQGYKLLCYSRYKEKVGNAHTCDCMVEAKKVEKEVVSCFNNFRLNLSNYEKKSQNKSLELKKSIDKTQTKIKKMYDLYFQNESDNLYQMISEEEKRLVEMNKEYNSMLLAPKESADIKEIKKMSDIFGDLSDEEKNKILKHCIEKIIISKDTIDIKFVI